MEVEGNPNMRIVRYLAGGAFFVAGTLYLSGPIHADGVEAKNGFVATRFSVVDAGTLGKPDVLLVPGLSSSRAVWDAEAKLLAPNYRLHLVQVDGFAGAPAGPNASGPLLVPVVEELHAYVVANKLHPVVIGHSLGGLLALMLADKHPEDVRKLVILDALPFSGATMDPAATVESIRPQAEGFKHAMLSMAADQYSAMQPAMAAQMVKDADAQKLVAADSIASDRAVVVNAVMDGLGTDLRPDMAGIKTPTLVIYAYDATQQQPDPKQYEAAVLAGYKPMPYVILVRIDDSRHFIMYDQPAKLDAALEVFLK
jgi:pimeloyl-ACP methyl ester carboxylesterase